MTRAAARSADELLRQADTAARDKLRRLVIDVPDEEILLPRRLWLRNRQIEIRGAGPKSRLTLRHDGDDWNRAHPLCIQPLDGDVIDHFEVRGLTLKLVLDADEKDGLGGLRVTSADDRGVMGGEVAGNTFLIETPLAEVRVAKSYLCNVGAQGKPVGGVWQRVRDVDVHDNVALHPFGKCFQFTYARECRAFRNLVLFPATPQRGRDNFAFRIVCASDCVFRDNAVYTRGGGKAQMTGFSINGLDPVPAERNAFVDNVIDVDAGAGVTLQQFAFENRIAHNTIVGRGEHLLNAIRLTSGEAGRAGLPIERNWFFANDIRGFPCSLLIETPRVIRDNRFVGSFERIDDRSGGANRILSL